MPGFGGWPFFDPVVHKRRQTASLQLYFSQAESRCDRQQVGKTGGEYKTVHIRFQSETDVEITVPLYPAGTVVNLYVAEVDKDGNLVTNDDKFAYDVEVTDGEVTLDAQNDTAEVTITNSETSEEESESETETESESESETESEKQTETESKGKKPTNQTTTAAKTGDNTPIGALAGALAVSAAVIVVYIRRRRKNEE